MRGRCLRMVALVEHMSTRIGLAALVVAVWVASSSALPSAGASATSTTTAPPSTTTAPPTTTTAPPATQVPAPPDPPGDTVPAVPAPTVPVPASSTPPSTGANLPAAQAEYARLQKDADAALADWSRANNELEAVRTEMVGAKLAAEAAGVDAEIARRQLAERAAALYRSGGAPEFMRVLDAGDLDELTTRSKYMKTVVDADRELILRAAETRERLEDRRAELEAMVATASRVEVGMRGSRDRVEAALQQQGYVVAKVDRVNRMPTSRSAAVAAPAGVRVGGARRDNMSVQPVVDPAGKVCPVGGPVTFSNDFGNARSGPPPHPHQGNDVFATYGTPLVAIADGVIFKSGNDGGLGGQRVWLRDTAGVTYYYAHMSRIDVPAGTVVSRGQVLGAVGNSGNARSTPSHVHFEMHPGGGAAVNPYGTLIRLC